MAYTVASYVPPYLGSPELEGIEMERKRSALADMLQRMQEEKLKEQEVQRGMAEEKTKAEAMRNTMLQRALSGWAPSPGVDVGQFSAGGAPMQWKAVGPGFGKARNIEEFPGWEMDTGGEEAQLLRRSMLFPKGMADLETPAEKEARQTRLKDVETQKYMAGLEKLETGRESRARAERERKEAEEAGKLPRQQAMERIKARNTEVQRIQDDYAKDYRQLQNAYMDMIRDPTYMNKLQEVRALFSEGVRRLNMMRDERLQASAERYGEAEAWSREEIVNRNNFVALRQETLGEFGIQSYDHLKYAAEQAGRNVEDYIAALQAYESERMKNAKSK